MNRKSLIISFCVFVMTYAIAGNVPISAQTENFTVPEGEQCNREFTSYLIQSNYGMQEELDILEKENEDLKQAKLQSYVGFTFGIIMLAWATYVSYTDTRKRKDKQSQIKQSTH